MCRTRKRGLHNLQSCIVKTEQHFNTLVFTCESIESVCTINGYELCSSPPVLLDKVFQVKSTQEKNGDKAG